MTSSQENEDDSLDELLKDKARIVELSDAEDEDDSMAGPPFPGNHLKPRRKHKSKLHPQPQRKVLEIPPWIFDTNELFHNDVSTPSRAALDKTSAECLRFLTLLDTQGLPLNSHGLPRLRRKPHADFLRFFLGPLQTGFTAMDASRPWLFYWCLAGLSFLDEDVSEYKERLIETVRPLQNPIGGFGGGHGQYSHCACTYATVLALTAVGGLEVVDRKTMWQWLGTVKQDDGGFRMAVGAEEDIRGAYCAMTIITLLNLPLELPPDAPARKAGLTSFTDKLGEWVGRCQTYEGGIGGGPSNEVHGAYAFCALACLSILDAPHISIPKYLDIDALARWLASTQTTPEGGFAGRPNKLVDACYSHWVGACFALIEAALPGSKDRLWNKAALVRYLLTCGQQPGPQGGMRDKPSARPDGYHTCYSLSGLSAAQNHYWYDSESSTTDAGSGRLLAAFNWHAKRGTADELAVLKVDEEDVVALIHPVFVLRLEAVEAARKTFEAGGL
ncbi:CAAX farnesyltransferase (FTase) subunit beta [Elasticomyces elasticus]|uniref:Protein farnesyltransferase subunit beta n=1 Tax=Elasticomyces elasticus TaxID=574655 RepID=A0AAN8A5S6_9PEZI|nr:CAAX farnesyltransferase (FTase) subunit beta [Elasticomyces elasticus]